MSSASIWQRTDLDLAAINRGEERSLVQHLGIEIVEVGDDFVSATMPVDERTLQPHGRLHGGASVALAETVGSLAANLTLNPAEEIAVGLEINANHVRPVKAGLVHATARPESLGRTTQIWSIRIVDDQQRLVCISRLTMAVIGVERK
ncbi:hotdog fold thioesterase [Novosphingobium sp. KCTC 2891]|uniref:hotdog fold thioesterase n=1 Tax=Novosphingobium sp. KCTC 2891 TaxID=2989730 RepID=UPI002222C98C|nr:hotdog fold thioesterase [Novosphingobium sp. KCTC 2891]MCW1384911.1 hotdog fold thioesterase [Novosphingobium sp. KCTC 2891]